MTRTREASTDAGSFHESLTVAVSEVFSAFRVKSFVFAVFVEVETAGVSFCEVLGVALLSLEHPAPTRSASARIVGRKKYFFIRIEVSE